MKNDRLVLPLSETGVRDLTSIDGRSACLGALIRSQGREKVNFADGFVISTHAYRHFLRANALEHAIERILQMIDFDSPSSICRGSEKIRQLIMNAPLPGILLDELVMSYSRLSEKYHLPETWVSLHTAVVSMECPERVCVNQQQAFHNVKGWSHLVEMVKRCFASLFTASSIYYWYKSGYLQFNPGICICVQKMVRPGMAASGIAFSLDGVRKILDGVVIRGSYGTDALLDEGVSPDEFTVFRRALPVTGFSLIEKKLGSKTRMLLPRHDNDLELTAMRTPKEMQEKFCLTDEQVLTIAEWVTEIEKQYIRIKGCWSPLNVEWAIDGRTRELYIVGVSGRAINYTKGIEFLKSRIGRQILSGN